MPKSLDGNQPNDATTRSRSSSLERGIKDLALHGHKLHHEKQESKEEESSIYNNTSNKKSEKPVQRKDQYDQFMTRILLNRNKPLTPYEKQTHDLADRGLIKGNDKVGYHAGTETIAYPILEIHSTNRAKVRNAVETLVNKYRSGDYSLETYINYLSDQDNEGDIRDYIIALHNKAEILKDIPENRAGHPDRVQQELLDKKEKDILLDKMRKEMRDIIEIAETVTLPNIADKITRLIFQEAGLLDNTNQDQGS